MLSSLIINEITTYVLGGILIFCVLLWINYDRFLARFFEHLAHIFNTDCKEEKEALFKTLNEDAKVVF